MTKRMKYGEAIRTALFHAMEHDPKVFVFGLGVDDHRAIFGSLTGLAEKFGPERVFDTPISEAAMTGVAVGAAVNGLKPVHVHIRSDFLYLAMDQLFNIAAKWRYMFGGRMNVPLVVRAVIGRSWGQGAQHSQSLHAWTTHIPGLKVVMRSTIRIPSLSSSIACSTTSSATSPIRRSRHPWGRRTSVARARTSRSWPTRTWSWSH